MAEGSSSGNQDPTLILWRCMFCPMVVPGVSSDSFEFCPKCGKKQKQEPPTPEILCINPECKATLFSEKAEICHICKKPQQQKSAATPTDSSKLIEEHKLKIAQAVASVKKQSQEAGPTRKASSHSASESAEDQSAAKPQKEEAQVPADHPGSSKLEQGATPENPIVIDSMTATIPDPDASAQATVADMPTPDSKGTNKSDAEGTSKDTKGEGNRLQDKVSTNSNDHGQNTDQPPQNTSSRTPGNQAAAKPKGTQDPPSSGPSTSKQDPSSNVPSSDSSKPAPDPNGSKPNPSNKVAQPAKPTGSGVPDQDLARMHIDEVRTQNRKRNLEGYEEDNEHPPKEAGGTQSAPPTYVAAAQAPAATQSPQTQSSVPPNKKQKNNTPKDIEPHGSSTGQENKTTHPSNDPNQSGGQQPYKKPDFDQQGDLFSGTGRGRARGSGGGRGKSDAGSQGVGRGNKEGGSSTSSGAGGVGRGRGGNNNAGATGRGRGAQSSSGGPGSHGMTTRSKVEPDTSGIHVSPDKSIEITFHALVPKDAWKWENNTKVTMRFGDQRLGNWNKDIGFLEEWKEFPEAGLVAMRCTLNFDVSLLNYSRPLAYKYLIYVPQDGKRPTDEAFEFLHNAPSKGYKPINRCLVIPMAKCKAKGKYHQYDNIVLPVSQEKSRLERFKAYIGWSSNSSPNHDDMQKKCLDVYLTAHKETVCDCKLSLSQSNISQAANGIVLIFRQLFSQKIYQYASYDWISHQLPKAMVEWILTLIDELQMKPVDSAEENGRRMASVLAIISCIYSLIPNPLNLDNFESRVIAAILSMLCLKPNLENRQHPDLDIVLSLLPGEKSRKATSEALCGMCTHLSSHKDLREPDWVYAIPLIHFLQKKSIPFDTLNPDSITWENSHLGLNHVKSITRNKDTSFIERLFDSLKPLTVLDPNFLPIIMFICPKPELPNLLVQVPSHLSVTWLSSCYLVETKGYWNKDDMKEFIKFALAVIECLKAPEEQERKIKDLDSTTKASHLLLKQLLNKLPISKEQYVTDSVKVVVTIVFYSVIQLSSCVKEHAELTVNDSTKKVQEVLVKFLDRNYGSTAGFVFDSPKEMMLFQSLLQLDCPRELQTKWENEIIQKVLKERVAKISLDRQIDLFCKLESPEKIHAVIADVLMEGAVRSLEVMTSKGETVVELYKNRSKQRGRVGEVLDKVLQKHYPKEIINKIQNLESDGSEILNLDELMDWDLWPCYLTVYKNEVLVSKGGESCLHEGTTLMCTIADSTIGNMCRRIRSGDITMKELDRISDSVRRKRMKKLCSAVGEEGVEEALEQKLNEARAFNRHRETLGRICDYVTDVHIKGLDRLKRQLKADYDNCSVKTLCTADGPSKFIYHRFHSAKPLEPIRMLFDFMERLYQNDLFHRVWSNATRKVTRRKDELTIQDIVDEIWRPAFKECDGTILGGLRNGSIKLQAVDNYFRCYLEIETIENHLHRLYNGVELCYRRNPTQTCPKWIHKAVGRIHKYWTLSDYAEAAETILELKDRLKLTGDFHVMTTIAEKVSTSMHGKSLKEVSDALIEAGDFLKEIQRDRKKFDCLRVFASSLDVVEWLRKETRSVDDLHNFVSVALHTTAGEDPYDSDQLSNLKKVGNAFGSLIYDLKEDKSFEMFRQGCLAVWDAMENATEELPELLRGCASELGWYKSVKETQGSIEETTFGQMNNILAYGCYQIGSQRAQRTYHSIHDIIHVTLTEREKRLTKKYYSLNDLRDLESKLALIVGKNAENRTEVGLFTHTLHNICRIAEVLISLQQVGNVKYMGWMLQVPCSLTTVVPMLQNLAKEMEYELTKWKKEVTQKRGDFYELNYYTTLQLLTLRRGLGAIKSKPNTGPAAVTPDVLALLESISTQVTAPHVHAIVQNVISDSIRAATSAPSISTQDGAAIISPSFSSPTVLGGALPSGVSTSPHGEPSLAQELFSSAEVHTSSGAEDMKVDVEQPKISEDELSQEQRGMMQDLIKRYAFSTQLVLKAFEECEANPTKYDIEKWCNDNTDKFIDTQSDGEHSEEEEEQEGEEPDDSSMDSDDEVYAYQRQATPLSVSASTSISLTSTGTPRPVGHSGIRQIEAQPQLPINKNHSVVQQLCSAGYTEEQSMDAVERYKTLEKSLNYLMSAGEEDEGVLLTVAPTRQDSTSLWRQSSSGVHYVEPLDPQYSDSEPIIECDSNAEKSYLSLEELGKVLSGLTKILQPAVPIGRSFNRILECGHPNLIVTPPDNVLGTVLALFMEDKALPLPSLEEVLICNPTTTAEEVTLLWERAIGDPEFKRIFCLVHAERLTYQVSDKALRSLSDLSQGRKDYRLVIICSNEEEEKSHIISKLHNCRRPFAQTLDVKQCQCYLKEHFTGQVELLSSSQIQPFTASEIDYENSCVRLVTSFRSGMGKSLFIQRMVEQLQMNMRSTGKSCVTVPLHGPKVTPDVVVNYLEKYMQEPACTIFHLDIAPTILSEVDTILFSLLILCGLTDSQGRVWRCHPGQLYAIELTLPEKQEQTAQVGQTVALTNLLPTVHCVSPREAIEMMGDDGTINPSVIVMDEQVFAHPICQRVYQYLRRHMGNYNLDNFSYIGNVEGTKKDCLEIFVHNCGIRDPSWCEIRHFINFLDVQLQSCEESVFCDEMFVGDIMSGLKSFVVKFMIRMSRDFATSSLQGEVARENLEDVEMDGEEEDNLEQYQIATRRRWERNSHPYIFFNQDRMSITFVGFMVTRNGDLVDPAHRGVLEQGIMTPRLYTGLKQNRVNFDDDYRQWQKSTMIEKIATVMGIEFPYDPDETYVLTVDNLIKILAIQMRFRCGIPVVIMGETGCGKTRLIRYMCELARQGEDKRNMLILKVHGGTTEKDIEKFIKQAEQEAERNRVKNMDTVAFFDEANTTDAIGLIKEIMCDRRIHGKSVSEDLKFIAACNPYRKHSEDMIDKLENAGLGFYVRETETHQKLGKIPLRQLVYRVLDLPPSMRPLVYDFGQLQQVTEDDYIRQIVHDHVTKHDKGLAQESPHYINAIARVLAWSQSYMRERKDECSFVSLRDVERAMIVFKYFYENMKNFAGLIDRKQQEEEREEAAHEIYESEDEEGEEWEEEEEMLHGVMRPQPQAIGRITRALILSLSVCYHARLQDRIEYEEGVSEQFVNPLSLPGGDDQFRDEIRWCQEVLLDNMRLGENIAKNAALRENVFMMAICIELRIPLFIVGKPGSSKSLAKAVIHASMRGRSSHTKLLRSFKEVDMFSYQCSQLSTPESVIEVFNTASRFQSKQDIKSYVTVVVLDEVGLAEDSPNLPLKALHPLLEDGTEGAGSEGKNDMIIAREERVAFIGISNWALDPAKMNRGVMVTRGDPSEDELEYSAEGICSNEENDPVKGRLKQYFKPLSKAYMYICKKQERQFFGLRDFYSLIKMLYWMCEKSGNPPTWPQLEHAIKRNFGGLESMELDPVKIFMDKLPYGREPPDLSGIPEELHSIVRPDCTRFGLIRASLSSKERTWHGENRYLLFLTENYAALDILKHYLSGVDSSQTLNIADVKQETMEPFVLFGSSFPKDQEYTQVCRNINQIKICMETGRTVILLNLENLYESLYDMLNQYYISNGGNRYVDLGLQTHRVRCRVHDDFKLILIAEKDTVYQKFPTPLINRLEKHFVLTSSILEDWQAKLLKGFDEWISLFCATSFRGRRFTRGDAFIGYQKDTPAAVVFQASNFLRRLREDDISVTESKLEVLSRAGILDNMPRNVPLDREEITEQWKDAVLPLSQFLLLQTASPDAIVRLESTVLDDKKEIRETYFKKLHLQSIEEFLTDQFQLCEKKGGLLIQVTTHSHLLAYDELEQIRRAIGMRVESCSLHEFETELDFTSKIGPYFKRGKEDESSGVLVIIQCDSGHSNGDLIACARNRIYDVRSEKEGDTHVVFVIHLPHQAANSSFVGFQGDPWISVHIDDLRPTSDSTIMPYEAMDTPISQLFLGSIIPDNQFGTPMNQEDAANEEEGKSDIEMDSKPSRQPVRNRENRDQLSVLDIEDEGESMDEDEIPPNEEKMSEGSGPEDSERGESMEEETAGAEQPQPMTLPPPQCQRLHGCIQAAASKLQDDNKRRATQRVEILVNLVPRDIQLPLDPTSFHGILVQHVFNVLKERDHIWEAGRQWVLNEAMDARKLQNGGTFRNVLARKIDDVVVPIFSEIIACMDRNCNLDLINPRSENTPLCQFWLNMFGRQKIMQFNYVEMMTPREKVPGVGGRRSAEDFKCQLPFSWIVKEAVDAQWDNAKSSAGNNRQALHKQLCEAVHQMEVGEVLTSVQDEYSEEFYKYYLHDYVRSIHKSQNSKPELVEAEYNLIEVSLDEMVHDDDFGSIDGHDTLIRRIAALHVVYMFNKSQIMWFGQLVSQRPGIMLALKEKQSPDTSEMMLHLFAVEKALDVLKPPMEKDDVTDHLVPWLNDLRLSQNAIDTILSLPPHNKMLEDARLKWQLIRAMQMFLEHVLMKNSKFPVAYARRLEFYLMSNSDFLKASALDKVRNYIVNTHKELKHKHKLSFKTLSNIQKSCREFFMEVVSNLCFSGHKPPEPELIKMLMNTVFTEKKQDASLGTRDMTPYQADPDHVPVVRSFLLQLLLEHNYEQVKEYLKDYFDKSHQAFGKQVDQGLCLLCIQCFEDALYKEFCKKYFVMRIEETIMILEDGHRALRQHGQYAGAVTLEYLEGVAKVRFALSVVAELLNQSDQPRSQEDGVLVVRLLHQAREICVDPNINSIDNTGQRDTVGPVVYLIKLLVRQYGQGCLQSASEAHAWIVPEQLKQTGEEEKIIDPFVIYNDFGYNHTRVTVSNAAYGRQLPRLVESTRNLNIQETVPLLLALYQKITLSRASIQPSKQIYPDVLGEFDQFIQQSKVLPREMQWMARSLIANEQGGPFLLLSVTPHQRPQCHTLTALVVHTTAVFFSRQKLEILWPFISMLANPANLANAYLPTMGEDHLQEVRGALRGAFYACPRGHPYYVGECGRPVQELTCLTCGAHVGGVNHQLRTDNVAARTNDITQTGHDLGDPNGRTTVPAPERNLSPPSICVLRALMHSAFLWACCNNEQRIGDIVWLVKPHVPVQGLSEFFWRHLNKDIELLGRAIGRGYEEAAMVVHLVLKEILTRGPPKTATVKTLADRNARAQWETDFNKHYIQRVLGSLEQKVGLAMHTILSDDDQEHDQLFFLVYERTELMNQSSIEPHLWTYHSRITLEYLAQTLQEKKMKKDHPILYEFLQAEPVLRATQYLPDIVRLQQCLYDAFHHRLDKKDAATQSIKQFLDRLTSENARNEYQEWIESLQKAWALVRHMLKNHARLRVKEEFLIPAITLDTTLEYLIPTTTEAGACTTALVDFLVLSHNDFIEKCRASISKDDMSAAFWREHKVPITHIHRCHLVDYEHQLLSIVLSHCNYSLTFGKGQEIKYDHHALEKHILDRFIHGKPRILSDIPHVVYRKDIYTTVTFAAVRKKVKNQEQLNFRFKQEIVSELRTPDRLREALDVVEIVLGFLSSGGGKADKLLGEYIDRMLKMKRRPFSSKAREYCRLGHILSLWETISVELARQLYLGEQEPFDSIRDDFLKPLKQEEKDALEKCLRLFDLDSLLGTLYEFIETHVKHSPNEELNWLVKETLEGFLDRNGLPQIQSFNEFPDSITISQAIAAWKYIVDYQCRVKQI